jgi:uncharacterized protein (TIGR02757 family)
MKQNELKKLLDKAYRKYNHTSFIQDDPICIPHRFSRQQDIEIMGLFAAVLAWGQRITIINKCNELIERMDGAPYQFITQHVDKDLQALIGFKHRTFNDTDLLYFVAFLRHWYSAHDSLETAFIQGMKKRDADTEQALNHFRKTFFSLTFAPQRTQKHISSPIQKSACKRLNMYLRWMVRKDKHGVDFGLWKSIKPSQLICPLDVHVQRVATELGLLSRTQSDWQAAVELTKALKKFDENDPVKYDFALFGIGVMSKNTQALSIHL